MKTAFHGGVERFEVNSYVGAVTHCGNMLNLSAIAFGKFHIPTLPRQGIGSFRNRIFVKCHQTGYPAFQICGPGA